MQVHKEPSRLGSRRIQVEVSGLGKATSFRCRTTSYTRGSHRSPATDSLQGYQVRLPCFCYQSTDQCLARLPLLFSTSHNREAHPGIGLRLSLSKDSDPGMNSQRCLLPDVITRLQSRSLFKRLCLPRNYHSKTLKTIRMELLVLPGRLIRAQKQYHLNLPRKYHFEQVFREALSKIEKLRELPIA